jgi:hypothetical protein
MATAISHQDPRPTKEQSFLLAFGLHCPDPHGGHASFSIIASSLASVEQFLLPAKSSMDAQRA